GPDAAESVVVSDPLPSGVVLVSATPSAGNCSGTSTVTCAIGTLAAGANASVTIVVTTTHAGTLTNVASATSATQDPVPGNNTSPPVVTTVIPTSGGGGSRADLGIAKSASPSPATAGQPLTYTLTITNHGPDAATGVGVADTIPAGVTFVS